MANGNTSIKKANTFCVGAIDFGTSNSGWAFSFKHQFEKDPTKVYVPIWPSGEQLVTSKAPTCALIAEDGTTLVAFGYEAENKYKELLENGEHRKYYYFRRFKLALNKKLEQVFDRNITIEDSLKRSLPAKRVFSLSIEFLVKNLLVSVNKQVTNNIKRDDIKWILTVPAIWTDAAKQFMTEAAIEAGISDDNLLIALEPEVASLYCRYLPVERAVTEEMEEETHVSEFKSGTRYMVVDAGGGTVDITVHEIEEDGGLREVHAASGGGWGGTMVDEAFEEFMGELVSKDVYDIFVQEQTEDWLDLCRDFERKKMSISPEHNSNITVKLPTSLNDICRNFAIPKTGSKWRFKKEKMNLAERINASQFGKRVTLAGDKLRTDATIMKNFFSASIEKTVEHIKQLLQLDKVIGITAILMVGGYSDSPMLHHAIKSSFPDLHVIIPHEAASIVLKGAVIFGYVPDFMKCRVLKYTYGYRCNAPFIEGVHPAENKITNDHGVRCKDSFSVYAKKNDVFKLYQPHAVRTPTPSYSTQTSIGIPIYATQTKPPVVVDSSLTKIGELSMDLDDHDGDINRKITFSMSFGGTVIEAQAKDEKTGKFVKATLNFLG